MIKEIQDQGDAIPNIDYPLPRGNYTAKELEPFVVISSGVVLMPIGGRPAFLNRGTRIRLVPRIM